MSILLRRLIEKFNQNSLDQNTEFGLLLLQKTLTKPSPNLLGTSRNYDTHIRTPNNQQCNYGSDEAKRVRPNIYTLVVTRKKGEKSLTPGCIIDAVSVENELIVNLMWVCFFSGTNIGLSHYFR